MELIIKHKKPLITHLDGKWKTWDTDIHFYIVEEGIKKVVEPSNEVRNYLLNTVINNLTIPGRYDQKLDSLIYKVDLEEHKMLLKRYTINTDQEVLIRLER